MAATKKIKAQSSIRSIELSVGGTSVLVDGKKVATNGEMKLIKLGTQITWCPVHCNAFGQESRMERGETDGVHYRYRAYR